MAIVIDGLRAHGSESALPGEPMCHRDLDATCASCLPAAGGGPAASARVSAA